MRLLPRVFVASSSEAVPLAKAIKRNLKDYAEVRLWDEDLFDIGKTVIEGLLDSLRRFDFAIFVFQPDDETIIRENEQPSVRDNVVFELGMFMGVLGRDRTFIVRPNDDLRSPTDLQGVIYATYDSSKAKKRPTLAMRKACNKISKAIVDRHKERAKRVEQLVKEGLQTICRLMGAPTPLLDAGIRAFIFRHEPGRHKDGQLVCWSFYDPADASKEKVGKTKFSNTSTGAKKNVVVKSFRENRIVGRPVEPAAASKLEGATGIKKDLSYVLAAPIRDRHGSPWGTVNFDANPNGEGLLNRKVAHEIIHRLAEHFSELLLK